MNKIILIGNLTKNPELRATPSGVSVCNFDIAVNERRGGETAVTYFRVTAWRQLGEICSKYLTKGKKVFVSGALSARTYQANDGSTRVQLEVNASEIEFLSGHNDDQTADTQEQSYQQQERQAMRDETTGGFTAVVTDDLPF